MSIYPGPAVGSLIFIGILIIFSPVFLLDWATKRLDWPIGLHDRLYLGYIVLVFGIIFVWSFYSLYRAIKRRNAIKKYQQKRRG